MQTGTPIWLHRICCFSVITVESENFIRPQMHTLICLHYSHIRRHFFFAARNIQWRFRKHGMKFAFHARAKRVITIVFCNLQTRLQMNQSNGSIKSRKYVRARFSFQLIRIAISICVYMSLHKRTRLLFKPLVF